MTDATEIARVCAQHKVVPLRMILEAKKDGRKKARLILQGFREPVEWDVDSNVSPVAHPSTIRSLIFMSGEESDVLSSIDVSVAFLQSDRYGPGDPDRYVSYRPYKDGPQYVCRLLGPVYGQRSAPRAWFRTVTAWLVGEMGYSQGLNEPCAFRHPVTGHRIVLFCDDFLCRGSREVSEQFYTALSKRFDCKDPTFLEPNGSLTFTGLDIEMKAVEGRMSYVVNQGRDMLEFLRDKGLDGVKLADSPMPDKRSIMQGECISENMQSWCRSVVGGMHFFARGTRWDSSQTVSRIAQSVQAPREGTVKAIERLAGYWLKTLDFSLIGPVHSCDNQIDSYCDSSHHGDLSFTSKSQSGVVILVNGAPVHWRSNRQPSTTLSPVESGGLRCLGWRELGQSLIRSQL